MSTSFYTCLWRELSAVGSKHYSSHIQKHYKVISHFAVAFAFTWQTENTNLTIKKKSHLTAGTCTSSHLGLLSHFLSFLSNPFLKLWTRFGLHHDSMQSGTEQGSFISQHAGVRGCVSLHAGAILCQETITFASTCHPGLHGSSEGNLTAHKHGGKNCNKGATDITTPF